MASQLFYKNAYLTLRDAVADTMRSDERPQWDDSQGMPEEFRVELLTGYLQVVKQSRDPDTLDEGSIAQNEMMQSWERAGFSHKDSMDLLKTTISLAAITRILGR